MYPVIDKEKTGKCIKQLMKKRNISVKEVRDYLSLESVQSVYYWLNGRSIPTIDNLYALSELLQVPIDKMVCGNRKSRLVKYECKLLARLFSYWERCLEYRNC